MLNREIAARARHQLEDTLQRYLAQLQLVEQSAIELHKLRTECNAYIFGVVQPYINTLADVPVSLCQPFERYQVEQDYFESVAREVEAQFRNHGNDFSFGGLEGLMGLSTSTGPLFKSHPLALLVGMGALTPELGLPLLAGQAASMLLGPLLWALPPLLALGLWGVREMNARAAQKANDHSLILEKGMVTLLVSRQEIMSLYALTEAQVTGMKALFDAVRDTLPPSYADFSKEQFESLAALLNHVQTLSCLLNKKAMGEEGRHA